MARVPDEEELLRSVALRNASTILLARQRAEEALLRAQEALRESDERLKAALAAAGTTTFRCSLASEVVEWDGNLDLLFDRAAGAAALPLEELFAALHPEDRPAARREWERCARGGEELDLELRVRSSGGAGRWIHVKARCFRDARGTPLYVTGACTDITRRRAAEEALRANEARLRAVFDQAAVGIAVADLDGRFVEMNRKFPEILGLPADELRGRTFADITHPDDLAETRRLVAELVAGARSAYSLEKRYVRGDGSVVWSLTSVTLLRDPSGAPERFVGVLDDITDAKRTEAALREQTRFLELLNATGTAVASTLDLDAVLQTVTDAATELSGARTGGFFHAPEGAEGDYRLGALSGGRPGAPRAPGERRAALAAPAFRADGPVRRDDLLREPGDGVRPPPGLEEDGTPARSYLAVPVRSRSAEVIGALVFTHPEPGVFVDQAVRLAAGVAAQAGIAIDNARLYAAAQKAAVEREALLESERAARAAAERLSDLKDEFLATLSHELRTPLNSILGWAQVLRTGHKQPAELLRGLERIERNARAQTGLIEDLLDMSRISAGKMRLEVQSVAPIAFVEAALETVAPAAEAKGVRVVRRLDPSAGPVSGDPGRLQQVVWNLLSNAIKFTPRGGTVEVALGRVRSHVEIRVADNGIGIRPEFVPHVFERFRQADASASRTYGGLGLGLSIVKSVVELHGGTVSARSPGVGLGTTVTVELPLRAVHAERRPPGEESPAPAPAPPAPAGLSGLTVLVVDDQPDARDLVQLVLEEASARVVTAASAAEALRLVEAERPDVLVSDIGMPGTDGFELLHQVRSLGAERGGGLPAIALTAFARSEDRTRALRAGYVVHVPKPVDASELVATVAGVAGRVRAAGGEPG